MSWLNTLNKSPEWKWVWFLPAFCYMAAIAWLSHRPAPESVQHWPIWWGIKPLHLLEYGGLAACFLIGFRKGSPLSFRLGAGAAWMATVLWGFSDEIHQSFVPSRTGRWEDLLADALGAGLMILGWSVYRAHKTFLHDFLWKK